MKTLRLVPLFVVVLMVSSCYYYYDAVTGSGVLVERELAYRDFDAIELYTDGEITIVPSADFAVRVKADDNVIDLITVYPADGGNTLRFGMDGRRDYNQVSIKIEIEMPVLKRLEAGGWQSSDGLYQWRQPTVTVETGYTGLETFDLMVGSGEVVFNDLGTSLLDVYIYGGKIRAAVACTDLELESFGGGVTLSGTADTIDLKATNSGEVDLSDLAASAAQVSIEQRASVQLKVSDSISGSVEHDAELIYDKSLSPDTTDLVIQ